VLIVYFLIWGFLVWLGATLIFRFFGHFFFHPENALLLLLSYLLVVPIIALLTYPLYKLKDLTKEERLKPLCLSRFPACSLIRLC